MSAPDRWSERLSEYRDGDLGPDEARACAEHVAGCAACTALLEDLDRMAREARALPARSPERDLWPGIAARLGERVEAGATHGAPADPEPAPRVVVPGARTPWWRRRMSLSMPQALAASLLLVALAGGGTWVALRPAGPRPIARAPSGGPVTVGPATRPAGGGPPPQVVASDDPRYDRTVAELQQLFTTQRAHLDTSTVRILDQNLAIIDRAVTDARRAVEADPSNVYLRSHLAATMRRKVELLRRATVIAGTQG